MTLKSTETATIVEALSVATDRLRQARVEEPRRDATTLLTNILRCDRAYLFTHDNENLTANDLKRFLRHVERRAAGEPLQYVTGRQEFYGLDFEVNPDVLIPRPETELLVETALELLQDSVSPLLCDVGTGSGCIPISVLHVRRDAKAFGLDISAAALRTAGRNAEHHGVADRLTFLKSDCFAALDTDEHSDLRFNVVVSNPPYVTESDFENLPREVRDHEPRVALTSGPDGFDAIRRLVSDTPRYLASHGHLVFEIGFDQHKQLGSIIDTRIWTLLDIRRDLRDIPRAAVLRLAR